MGRKKSISITFKLFSFHLSNNITRINRKLLVQCATMHSVGLCSKPLWPEFPIVVQKLCSLSSFRIGNCNKYL